jgi:hypothetical protein
MRLGTSIAPIASRWRQKKLFGNGPNRTRIESKNWTVVIQKNATHLGRKITDRGKTRNGWQNTNPKNRFHSLENVSL